MTQRYSPVQKKVSYRENTIANINRDINQINTDLNRLNYLAFEAGGIPGYQSPGSEAMSPILRKGEWDRVG